MSLQFFIVLTLAAVAGVFASAVSVLATGAVIRARVENTEYIEENIRNRVEEFQQYVTINELSTKNIEQVSEWVHNEGNVILAISCEGNVIYDSTDFRFHIMENNSNDDIYNIYRVRFTDREAEVALYELIETKYYAMANIISLFVGLAVFLIICITFVRKKVKYITLLDREVNMLEGGDLEYKLTVKGRDELSYLAKSIDDMRISILNKQKEEETEQMAKHKLVTTMSHDLRTPLTVLIGLLEIIDGKKYKDEKELGEYITKAKNKSYRIKELSDKIFEYFFAFDIKESALKKEVFETEVINTMIEDYVFSLSEKGYDTENRLNVFEKKTEIDINLFSRVIDNIFSNIIKYADKEKAVVIENMIENDFLKMTFSNHILPKAYKEESTNIGLEVCMNIIKQHNGSFEYTEEDGVFTAVIKIPLCR